MRIVYSRQHIYPKRLYKEVRTSSQGVSRARAIYSPDVTISATYVIIQAEANHSCSHYFAVEQAADKDYGLDELHVHARKTSLKLSPVVSGSMRSDTVWISSTTALMKNVASISCTLVFHLSRPELTSSIFLLRPACVVRTGNEQDRRMWVLSAVHDDI